MGICLDGAASGVTKRRHDVIFPLLTYSTAETFVYIFLQELHIFHTKNR
jgi:hypothetical protein